MFDELHDAHPPTADNGQLAAVAERAAAMRRRRRAVAASLGALALVAGGTVAVALTSTTRGDGVLIAGPSPEAATTSTGTQTTTVATSNPVPYGSADETTTTSNVASERSDPALLPTTGPMITTPGITTTTDSTPIPADTSTTGATSTPVDTSTTAPPPMPAETSPTAPNPPAQSPPQPITAITGDGDAVYFADVHADAAPTLLYDGPDIDDAPSVGDGPNLVDRVSVAPDGSAAYIGLCCAPNVGTVVELPPPTPQPSEPSYGNAPVFSPSGRYTAVEAGDSTVSVTDRETGDTYTSQTADPGFQTSFDLTWLDETSFAVLGNVDRTWTLTMHTVGPDGIVVDFSRQFAIFSEFDHLAFAGTAIDGEIAVHDVGTDRVLSGTLDDYGNNNGAGRGSSLQVIDLPRPALSAWYTNPGELIWVDDDRTLYVGNRVIPGEYIWARPS